MYVSVDCVLHTGDRIFIRKAELKREGQIIMSLFCRGEVRDKFLHDEGKNRSHSADGMSLMEME
jgi:hypothetical protein